MSYRQKFGIDTSEGLKKACESASKSAFIVVVVNDSVSPTLPRPSETAHEFATVGLLVSESHDLGAVS